MTRKKTAQPAKNTKGQFLPQTPASSTLATAMATSMAGGDPGEAPEQQRTDLPPAPVAAAPGPDTSLDPPPAAEAPPLSAIESAVLAAPPLPPPNMTHADPAAMAQVAASPPAPSAGDLLAQARILVDQATAMSGGPPVAAVQPMVAAPAPVAPVAQQQAWQQPMVASAMITSAQAQANVGALPIQPMVPAAVYRDPSAMTTVVPLKTVPKLRIGTNWYAFGQGQPCTVSVGVSVHLREKHIIA